MTQYVNLDMTLGELASIVLDEFNEPVSGSSAMPLHTVYDKINEVYLDIFNEAEEKGYTREGEYTFQSVANTTLADDASAGAITLTLADASSFPNATRTILLKTQEFATYTGSDLATTLTGVSGVDVDHFAGDSVQLGYNLSSITDLDEQSINKIFINGLEIDYMEPHLWLQSASYRYRNYTIYNGILFLPPGLPTGVVTILYEKVLTMLTTSGAKPTLIPGKFRPALLGSGAIVRMGVRDDMRTGWDYHQQRYSRELRKFFAAINNRVHTKGVLRRPSIYDL